MNRAILYFLFSKDNVDGNDDNGDNDVYDMVYDIIRYLILTVNTYSHKWF